MPSLGGITAWISIGDLQLPEYGVEIEDDRVKCYVEVPPVLPALYPPPSAGSPPRSISSPRHGTPHTPPPPHAPLEYTINWKIQDLTYTMVAAVNIDGVLQIEKIHLGKGTITAAKNTQSIDSVPITDDWSKRRLLTFVKLQPSDHASLPLEPVGSIKLALFRSGRANLSSGFKTSATGFHTKSVPDPKKLVKEATVDGMYSKSHATGLGPITFGPPKKVWQAATRDPQPYVTFEFLYRSRELITEALPDEGWELAAPPVPINLNTGMPPIEKERSFTSPLRRGRTRTLDQYETNIAMGSSTGSHPPVSYGHPPVSGGANLVKRPSLANRAKKWASDVKNTTQSIRGRRSESHSRVEVVGTPLDAINNPFSPRNADLPRTPMDGESLQPQTQTHTQTEGEDEHGPETDLEDAHRRTEELERTTIDPETPIGNGHDEADHHERGGPPAEDDDIPPPPPPHTHTPVPVPVHSHSHSHSHSRSSRPRPITVDPRGEESYPPSPPSPRSGGARPPTPPPPNASSGGVKTSSSRRRKERKPAPEGAELLM